MSNSEYGPVIDGCMPPGSTPVQENRSVAPSHRIVGAAFTKDPQ